MRGDIGAKAIGAFNYDKLLNGEDGTIPCEVKVFPLRVKRQAKTWPEMEEREFRWLTLDEASTTAGDEGLQILIQSFAPKANLKNKKKKSRQPLLSAPQGD